MPINRRQEKLFTYTVDLYRPTLGGEYTLAYSGVRCFYQSTPEVDEPRSPGRSKVVNIFTLDQFHFLPEQEIADAWALRLTNPMSNPDAGSFWVVEGNPQTKANSGRRSPNYRLAYGKRVPPPTIVEATE